MCPLPLAALPYREDIIPISIFAARCNGAMRHGEPTALLLPSLPLSQEEDAQAKALYILLHKKQVREQPRAQQGGNGRPATIYDEDWTVMTPPDGMNKN